MQSSPAAWVPQPPRLAYLNDGLRQTRTHSASRRPGTANSAASTTVEPSLRPGTAALVKRLHRSKAFLQDNEAAGELLPQALPNGIPYAASFASYDELIDRKILHQNEAQQVHLSTEAVRVIFEEKCKDQNLKCTWEREMRFLELLSTHCGGQYFSLRENGLGPHCASAIAAVLSDNETYTFLDLSGNRLRDAGAGAIARLLFTNSTILHLSLRSNDVGAEGVEALAEVLRKNNTLTSLDLGGISGINRNHVGARGAMAIGKTLKTNQVLCMLDLSSNGLGLDGIGYVSEGLGSHSSITKLDLSSNNIGPDGCRILASHLAISRVQDLNLERNGMGDIGVGYLAECLRFGTNGGDSLRSLNLDQNGLREAGAKEIAKLMKNGLQRFENLRLARNDIGPGASDIAEALSFCRPLKELNLTECGFGEKEACALGNSLGSAKDLGLARLLLCNNRIGDNGGKMIIQALRKNSGLKKIDLSGCALASLAGKALVQLIQENKTLTSINLRQNMISAEVGEVLREAIRDNKDIRELDLTFNDIPYQAFTAINQILVRNRRTYAEGKAARITSEKATGESTLLTLKSKAEETESKRQQIKTKGDELHRKKETLRGLQESNAKKIAELREKEAIAQAACDEQLRLKEEQSSKLYQEEQKLIGDKNLLQQQINTEASLRDKIRADTEKLRKQQKTQLNLEEEALKPLQKEFEEIDDLRAEERNQAQFDAEHVVELELKIRNLERLLGCHPEKTSGETSSAPATGRKGRQSRPGSGSRR